jgi:hypothetical protein
MKKPTPAQKAWKAVKAQSSSEVKKEIQKLLRQIVIIRDGGCIFRHYPEAGACSGWGSVSGELVIQADHISSRGNSLTYGLSQNVIGICAGHHGFWKKRHPALWAELTRKHIGEERFKQMVKLGSQTARQSFTAYDWGKVAIGLKAELKQFQEILL